MAVLKAKGMLSLDPGPHLPEEPGLLSSVIRVGSMCWSLDEDGNRAAAATSDVSSSYKQNRVGLLKLESVFLPTDP